MYFNAWIAIINGKWSLVRKAVSMDTKFPVPNAAEQGRQSWPKTAADTCAAADMDMSLDRAVAAAVIKYCRQIEKGT